MKESFRLPWVVSQSSTVSILLSTEHKRAPKTHIYKANETASGDIVQVRVSLKSIKQMGIHLNVQFSVYPK